MSNDNLTWRPHLTVRQYSPETVALAEADGLPLDAYAPDEVQDIDGNLVTSAGIARIWSLLGGAGGTAVTSSTARIGVGNSSAAEAVGQTDLQAGAGSSNRWFSPATVTVNAGSLALSATFASADGNFTWAEWGIDVGASNTASAVVAALLLNRKVSAMGTKVAGSVWTATATLTLA